MMNILITGAAGFVGKNLTAALECIRDGKENTFNPAFESRETIRLLHTIEESGNQGGKTVQF